MTEMKEALDIDDLTKNITIKVRTSINFGIQGTCQKLEKPYFRLTQAPNPEEVRPEPVLKKTLKLMKKKWKNQENDYRYIDEQFRSMR